MKPYELKTAVITPAVLGALDPDFYGKRNDLRAESDAFEKVPLLFRAVRLRCNALTRVPLYVYPIGGEEPIDSYPYEEQMPLERLLWLLEASLLLKGAAFTVKLADELGGGQGYDVLNPFTMEVSYDKGVYSFKQQINGQTRTWPEDEMMFIREYSPTRDVGFGTAPASVAMDSSSAMHYVSRFASQFFENGAMPVVVMGLPPGTQTAEQQRVESFFKRTMQGIRNAFKVLAVTGEIKPTIITPPLSELALPDIDMGSINRIAWAFDIPKTILTADSANYATAEVEYRIFTEQTIVPRCKFYESELNKAFKDLGICIEFAPQELNEMQEDESSRASAWKTYVDGGMDPELAASILGVDIPEGWTGEKWKKPNPVPPQLIAAQPPADTPPDTPPAQEMKKWEKKSLKRVKEGKSAQVDFESDHLPEELKSVTYAALGLARSEDDVKLIFRGCQ